MLTYTFIIKVVLEDDISTETRNSCISSIFCITCQVSFIRSVIFRMKRVMKQTISAVICGNCSSKLQITLPNPRPAPLMWGLWAKKAWRNARTPHCQLTCRFYAFLDAFFSLENNQKILLLSSCIGVQIPETGRTDCSAVPVIPNGTCVPLQTSSVALMPDMLMGFSLDYYYWRYCC